MSIGESTVLLEYLLKVKPFYGKFLSNFTTGPAIILVSGVIRWINWFCLFRGLELAQNRSNYPYSLALSISVAVLTVEYKVLFIIVALGHLVYHDLLDGHM